MTVADKNWISLGDAALRVYRRLFADREQRSTVDKIRKRIRYAVQHETLQPANRDGREGFTIQEFTRWAAGPYPGAIGGVVPVRGAVRLAFKVRGRLTARVLPPELVTPPEDPKQAHDLALRYWRNGEDAREALETARSVIASRDAELANYRQRDAQRRARAQESGKKGGRPRIRVEKIGKPS
ncbi:MAG: hypothetical protein IT481_01520 [Gammaproteobacteria bacterium]|nr:hypothetical protein [Gammaproteobacteria bacterium]